MLFKTRQLIRVQIESAHTNTRKMCECQKEGETCCHFLEHRSHYYICSILPPLIRGASKISKYRTVSSIEESPSNMSTSMNGIQRFTPSTSSAAALGKGSNMESSFGLQDSTTYQETEKGLQPSQAPRLDQLCQHSSRNEGYKYSAAVAAALPKLHDLRLAGSSLRSHAGQPLSPVASSGEYDLTLCIEGIQKLKYLRFSEFCSPNFLALFE